MKPRIWTVQVVIATVCMCQMLFVGQAARCQSAADATALGSPHPKMQTQGSVGNARAERRLYLGLLGNSYELFLEYAAREDSVNQSGQRPTGIDYESAIGIGDGEEEAMLEIIADAGPQIIAVWDDIDATTLKLMQEHGENAKINDDLELKALRAKVRGLTSGTTARLRHETGAEFMKKLDAYVYREFSDRFGPLTLRGFTNPDAVEARSKDPHDRLWPYFTFFWIAGDPENRTAQQQTRNGTSEDTLGIYVPRDKLQAVIAIARDTKALVNSEFAKDDATIGLYHQTHGPGPIPIPAPCEFGKISVELWSQVEKGVKNLKASVGEEEFANLDRSVREVFGQELRQEASASAGETNIATH
jgi:hypothetical protein